MSAYSLLREQWEALLAELPVRPSVWLCHRVGPAEQGFAAYGGLQAARGELMSLQLRRAPPVPCLLFGFQAVDIVRRESSKRYPGSELLLDWPGAAYLRYDSTATLIRETAARVVAGCVTPLPEGFLHDFDGLLRLSKAIRHWLLNRRTVVEHTLEDFSKIVGKPSGLSPFYLTKQPVLSDEHQADIRRLEAFQGVHGLSPTAMGTLRTASETILQFERTSSGFESAKAQLRGAQITEEQWPPLKERIEAVLAALDRSIEATQNLHTALEEAMDGGNDEQNEGK